MLKLPFFHFFCNATNSFSHTVIGLIFSRSLGKTIMTERSISPAVLHFKDLYIDFSDFHFSPFKQISL